MTEMRGPTACLMTGAMSVLVVAALLLAPYTALAGAKQATTNRQLCRRYTKQIAHYENDVLPLAEERRNELWADATLDQIDHLKNRRADACPEYGKQRSAMRKAADQAAKAQRVMKAAAKAAARYFSGGAW